MARSALEWGAAVGSNSRDRHILRARSKEKELHIRTYHLTIYLSIYLSIYLYLSSIYRGPAAVKIRRRLARTS